VQQWSLPEKAMICIPGSLMVVTIFLRQRIGSLGWLSAVLISEVLIAVAAIHKRICNVRVDEAQNALRYSERNQVMADARWAVVLELLLRTARTCRGESLW
jgi:hypothetical protein